MDNNVEAIQEEDNDSLYRLSEEQAAEVRRRLAKWGQGRLTLSQLDELPRQLGNERGERV